ncbi:MAG TPA: alpha/beta fold hydrolase, partial [Chitinophagaceae bacterium]|nr:alpha/beta fold hydrolase [Chitinophagaceae bacterium]
MYRLITYLLSILIGLQIQAQCDPDKRPIIFMHGFLASGDSYAGQVQRFVDAGYCPDRLFVFDWNSVNGNVKKTDSLLNALIDEVLKKTNAAKVDLVGHSAGGGLGRSYLADSVHATKIAHYVHIGSRKWSKDLSWFPNEKCLNVWSPADKVMGSGGGDVNGAINLSLKDKDHYEVATCYATWSAMYQFFNDLEVGESVPPPMVSVPADGGYSIGGKAVLLGDNTPMRGAAVHVWSVKSVNGKRYGKEPIASFTVSDDGKWGPVKTKQNEYYELELIPAEKNQRTISYYIGRVDNDDHFIYLRGFPQGNMVSMMLGSLPAKEDQSVIVI